MAHIKLRGLKGENNYIYGLCTFSFWFKVLLKTNSWYGTYKAIICLNYENETSPFTIFLEKKKADDWPLHLSGDTTCGLP